MSNQAPITALITVYNGSDHLAEAIQSVQRQTLPVAEILVVDDGSTDGSADLARSLGARVICQENQGAASARSNGMRAVAQEWVAMLDHDDLWEADRIRLQWKAHELCPDAGLIVADFCEFDDGSGVVRVCSAFNLWEAGFHQLQRHFVADGISYIPRVDEQVLTTIKKNIFFPSATLVRRDLAVSVGLFQDDLFPVDDIDFFLRCFAVTPVAFVERPLMLYRLHESNVTKNELRMLLAFFKFIQRMRENPKVFPAGALRVFTAQRSLARKYSDAGRLMLHASERFEARRLLKESLLIRKSFVPLIYWLLTWFSASTFACLLRAKRGLQYSLPSRMSEVRARKAL